MNEQSTFRQRRLLIKSRAKSLTGHYYFKLLIIIALYQVPIMVFNTLSGMLAFPGPTFTVIGTQISLFGELFVLLLFFISAPLELGAFAFLQGIERDEPPKVLTIFDWLGNSSKLLSSLQYALWGVFFHLITYPLSRFPQLFITTRAAEMVNKANTIMAGLGSNATLSSKELSAVSKALLPLAGPVYLALLILLIAMVLSFFFAPLPYLLAENAGGRRGFFSMLKESICVITPRFLEYTVFLFSFAGWYFIGFVIFSSQYIMLLFYPYLILAQVVFLHRVVKDYRQKHGIPDPNAPIPPAETPAK